MLVNSRQSPRCFCITAFLSGSLAAKRMTIAYCARPCIFAVVHPLNILASRGFHKDFQWLCPERLRIDVPYRLVSRVLSLAQPAAHSTSSIDNDARCHRECPRVPVQPRHTKSDCKSINEDNVLFKRHHQREFSGQRSQPKLQGFWP